MREGERSRHSMPETYHKNLDNNDRKMERGRTRKKIKMTETSAEALSNLLILLLGPAQRFFLFCLSPPPAVVGGSRLRKHRNCSKRCYLMLKISKTNNPSEQTEMLSLSFSLSKGRHGLTLWHKKEWWTSKKLPLLLYALYYVVYFSSFWVT